MSYAGGLRRPIPICDVIIENDVVTANLSCYQKMHDGESVLSFRPYFKQPIIYQNAIAIFTCLNCILKSYMFELFKIVCLITLDWNSSCSNCFRKIDFWNVLCSIPVVRSRIYDVFMKESSAVKLWGFIWHLLRKS